MSTENALSKNFKKMTLHVTKEKRNARKPCTKLQVPASEVC